MILFRTSAAAEGPCGSLTEHLAALSDLMAHR
jgi:hypothetical protein